VVNKQIFLLFLPSVSFTKVRWKRANGHYLEKCNFTTKWQVFKGDKCSSNIPIVGTRLNAYSCILGCDAVCANVIKVFRNSRLKITLTIVQSVTGKKFSGNSIHTLDTDGAMTDNHHVTSDSFNNYFHSITDKLTSKINDNKIKDVNSTSPVDYLFQIYKNPFPDMKTDRTSNKEIEKIIKSSKSKNSHGCDEIPIQLFLKYSIYQFSLKMHMQ